MISLTCKHHPELRWSIKEIAWTPGYGYNGCRSLHYVGDKDGNMVNDKGIIVECSCSTSDLVKA